MLAKMGASVIGALLDAAKIILLVMVVIALIGWAKTHPDQAQALVTKAMNTLMTLANRFLSWVATLGSN